MKLGGSSTPLREVSRYARVAFSCHAASASAVKYLEGVKPPPECFHAVPSIASGDELFGSSHVVPPTAVTEGTHAGYEGWNSKSYVGARVAEMRREKVRQEFALWLACTLAFELLLGMYRCHM